jgi:outer membrane protein W
MKAAIKVLLLLAFLCRSGFTQSISFGFRAGVPLTDAVWGWHEKYWEWIPESKPYTLGPAVALRLHPRISVEVDALYKRIGYSRYGSYISQYERVKTRADSWEVPVIARYRLLSSRIRPYLAGGFSYHHISSAQSITQALVSGTWFVSPLDRVFELQRTSNWGATVAIGAETKLWKAHLLPEIRYTRWSSDIFRDPASPNRETVGTNRDQVEFLLGIMVGR